MNDHERFYAILDCCHTTNGSGRPVYALNCLDNQDLVDLYDLAPDYSYLFDGDGCSDGYWTIETLTLSRAGMEPLEDVEAEESIGHYEKAVEILREKVRK